MRRHLASLLLLLPSLPGLARQPLPPHRGEIQQAAQISETVDPEEYQERPQKTEFIQYDYQIVGYNEVIAENGVDSRLRGDIQYPVIDYEEKREEELAGDPQDPDLAAAAGDDKSEEREEWSPELVNYEYDAINSNIDADPVVVGNVDSNLDYNDKEERTRETKLFTLQPATSGIPNLMKFEEEKIFNLIMVAGGAVVCLILVFGLLSLAALLLTRHTQPTNSGQERVVRNNRIITSYAKLPVQMKNVLSSNVAYKELYDA